MAAKALLPGFGGSYTSESFSSSTTGVDTIDASSCEKLAFQVSSSSAVGSVDVQQSFVSGKWSTLVASIPVTDGSVVLVQDGPFGLLRFVPAITSGSCTVTVVGFEEK